MLVFFGIYNGLAFAQTESRLFREAQPLPEAVPQAILAGPPPALPAGEKAARQIIVRSRRVQLTPSAIVGRRNKQGADSLDLNLFDNVRVSAKKDRVEQRSDTDYTWFGTVAGHKQSYVIIVVGDESIAGIIVFDNKTFQINYAGNGAHNVQEVDVLAFPDEGCKAAAMAVITASTTTCNDILEDGTVIDVLVVYTASARSNAGGTTGIVQQIQLGIDQTNMTYANSGITQKVRLAHAAEVLFTELGSLPVKDDPNGDANFNTLEKMLNWLADPSFYRQTHPNDYVIDNIHALRTEYAADLVSLWVEFGDGTGTNALKDCGYSSLLRNFGNTCTTADGFNVVSWRCATSYYTFAHEMGHNMGAWHDRYQVFSGNLTYMQETSPYSFGFVRPYSCVESQWRTIMAYKDQCGDCPRIPQWSNPYRYYDSYPTGIPKDTPGAADNSSMLNATASRVANLYLAHDLRVTITGFLSSNKVVPSFGRMDWNGASGLGRYKPGKVVTLTAAPDSVSTFTGWSGEGCSGTGTCTVAMDRARSVTANFYKSVLKYPAALLLG